MDGQTNILKHSDINLLRDWMVALRGWHGHGGWHGHRQQVSPGVPTFSATTQYSCRTSTLSGKRSARPASPRWGAALIFLLVFGLPDWVIAHAYLERAEPKVGARIAAPPSEMTLYFDAEIEPAFSTMKVLNAKGDRVDRNDTHIRSDNPMALVVSLPLLPPDRYEVFWSVVAVDTHRTEGRFIFTLLSPDTASGPGP